MSTERPAVPELTIAIVTWNSAQDIGRCLDALATVLREPHDVIIVDNASTDDTCTSLNRRGFTPPAQASLSERRWLICNRANRGFAAANNQALALSRTPYTLFLNPDTEVQPGSIETMRTFLDTHADVVAVGPRLTDGAGHIQGGAAGHDPTPWTIFNYSFGLYNVAPRLFPALWLARSEYETREPIEVDWVSGAALMVRTEVARSVGGWPEDYFLYMEDVAFCRRLRTQGRVLCLPSAHVVHHIGGSVGQMAEAGLARNILGLDQDYRSRYAPPVVALLHLIGGAGFALRWLAATLLRRERVEGHSASARHLWRACTLTSLHCLRQALSKSTPLQHGVHTNP